MKCPSCKLENPPGAMRCDCGYGFTTGQAPIAPSPQSISRRPQQSAPAVQLVTVTDVKMPFWSMVVFMIKWAFAAIPALLIVSLIILLFNLLVVMWLFGWTGHSLPAKP